MKPSGAVPVEPTRGYVLTMDYRVWVDVVVAALAMVATLPGRTHGLGLITEPLLADLKLDRFEYAAINLWATLFGALFCLPCGLLIDRLGTRSVLTAVLLGLGGIVAWMSRVQGDWLPMDLPVPAWIHSGAIHFAGGLFLLVLLTRGLGQSALSVVSLALIGRSVHKKAGPAFGVYSFVVAAGFMCAFRSIQFALERYELGWRSLWQAVGIAVMGFGVLAYFLVQPREAPPAGTGKAAVPGAAESSWTLGQALLSPTFWIFALATSLFGAINAGLSLFNQSILEERGFDRNIFLTITTYSPLVGLASNLATGWLATRWSMGRLLCIAMLVLAVALSFFPRVENLAGVFVYAVAMAGAGGMVTVLFFAIWSHAFGPAHLGKIQGAAQLLTVLASGLGPLVLAASKQRHDSYVPLFYAFAGLSALLGITAWFTRAGDKPAATASAADSGELK